MQLGVVGWILPPTGPLKGSPGTSDDNPKHPEEGLIGRPRLKHLLLEIAMENVLNTHNTPDTLGKHARAY
jgi:hypothetical protein